MACKARIWLAALVLTLGLVPAAGAFPPFPPFQCPWHEAKECPCTSYSCCHYFVPSYYACRAYHTPPRYIYGCPVDQTFTGYRIDKYPCMSADSRAQTAIYTESGSRQRGVEESASEQTPQAPQPAQTPQAPRPGY